MVVVGRVFTKNVSGSKMVPNIHNRLKRLLALVLIVILMNFIAFSQVQVDTAAKQSSFTKPKPTLLYGIKPDGFVVRSGTVKPGQTLSDILKQWNVPYALIHEAAVKSSEVFDVRRIKSDNFYCIISNPGPDKTVRYFVYEQTPADYVVFDLGDPVEVYTGRKAVKIRTRITAGKIESSLWETLLEQKLDYKLAIKLSEIYAWTIDFYHLQEGDGFKVIFEEKYVEGNPVGLGRIKATRFDHGGQTFYAFYFKQDGSGNYYGENGNSLQKAFLNAPIKYARISSGFSKRRLHPVLNSYRKHLGIDYAAPAGTPIITVSNGVVLETGYSKSAGKYVKVKHNGIYMSQYLHMSGFAEGIKPGVQVKQGDIIGYVGSTGLTTGPNLDFRFWKNGKLVDFSKVDLPAGEPVKTGYIDLFNQGVARMKQQLDTKLEPLGLFR